MKSLYLVINIIPPFFYIISQPIAHLWMAVNKTYNIGVVTCTRIPPEFFHYRIEVLIRITIMPIFSSSGTAYPRE